MNFHDPDTRAKAVAIALTFVICGLLWSLVQAIRPPAPWTLTPTLAPPPLPSATPTATPTATVPPETTEQPTASVTPVEIDSPAPTPTASPTPVLFTDALALRHDAMESVFYWFPERRDLRADAFIAMFDCAHIGRWYWLRLPDGKQYRAVVTDCMQAAHQPAHRAKWGDTLVIEIDGVFWRDRGLTMQGGVQVGIAEAGGP